MTVLVGRTAEDNDILSVRLAAPRDFWFHVAAESGSHVVVRNPEGLERLPRRPAFAASLAAGHSKARNGGRVAVHDSAAGGAQARGFPPARCPSTASKACRSPLGGRTSPEPGWIR